MIEDYFIQRLNTNLLSLETVIIIYTLPGKNNIGLIDARHIYHGCLKEHAGVQFTQSMKSS